MSSKWTIISWVARVLALGVLLAISALALFWAMRNGYVTVVLEWVRSLGWKGNVLMAAAVVAAHMPFLAGYLMAASACGLLYHLRLGFATLFVGGAVGCVASYLVSQLLLRSSSQSERRPELTAIIDEIRARPWIVGLLLRLTPLSIGMQNAMLASSPIRFHVYVLTSLVGMVPKQLLLVYLGYSVGDLAKLVSGDYEFGWPQLAMLLLGLCGVLLMLTASAFLARGVVLAIRRQRQADAAEAAAEVVASTQTPNNDDDDDDHNNTKDSSTSGEHAQVGSHKTVPTNSTELETIEVVVSVGVQEEVPATEQPVLVDAERISEPIVLHLEEEEEEEVLQPPPLYHGDTDESDECLSPEQQAHCDETDLAAAYNGAATATAASETRDTADDRCSLVAAVDEQQG